MMDLWMTSDAAPSAGRYQCRHCTQRYKRSDYLARHMRSHTKTKPYVCHVCSKAYSRVDILARHVAGHKVQRHRDNKRDFQQNIDSVSPNTPSHPPTMSGDGDAGQNASPKPSSSDSNNYTAAHLDRDMATTQDWDWGFLWSTAEQLSASMPSIDFDSVELELLDAYNVNIPFQLECLSETQLVANNMPTPIMSNALSWPASQGASSKSHLIISQRATKSNSVSITGLATPHKFSEQFPFYRRLTTATRDEILTTLIGNSTFDDAPKALTLFPSVELLNGLLQYYMTSSVSHASSFIHLATFDPNNTSPELLAAMTSSASLLTLDHTLYKLGLAIQESLLATLPRYFEAGNSITRDLELAQAFLITLEVGAWSGHIKNAEAAESFLQPLLTMIRRTGRMKFANYPPVAIHENHSEDFIESLWVQWVRTECLKRLVFRVLRHDTCTSMALQVNPMISYAEVRLPLPSSTCLWHAPSAQKWKTAFLAQKETAVKDVLTVEDFLDGIAGQSTLGQLVDIDVARDAVLSRCWSLSWEYIQMRWLQKQSPQRLSSMIMTLRYEELSELLRNFHSTLNTAHPLGAEMKANHIQLHLHMPFQELKIFVETRTFYQTEKVYPMLDEWSRSEPARRSVWYAGQMIRIAASAPQATLRGPAALMMYHASLALLGYGTLYWNGIETAKHAENSTEARRGQFVRLDGALDTRVEEFLQFGQGTPCIQGSTNTCFDAGEVSLEYGSKVAGSIIKIFRGNYQDGKPPIVEQMVRSITGAQESLNEYFSRVSARGY
ncbi:hypothetical protein B0J13DRAFT_560018 [Dactylonectria estremocensis]|uniref:C2H2-type domain-containing protein n=1 Tax=Dactylonectria estremocensis TaxID=1079267 RepID=A0A9P9ECE3_9HYPO|nr:hypothetical protein B0J13DRAFT_560018 [Dactylonectria estremocensis]